MFNLNKITPLFNASNLFRLAGLVTTAGSAYGTYQGIESEFGNTMAVIGSAVLAAVTYGSVNTAFNHTGWLKRTSAGVIAAACIAVSGTTIYLHATNTIQLVDQQSSQAAEQIVSADNEKRDADLLEQRTALHHSNTADRAAANERKNGLKTQIAEIVALNVIDGDQIAGFQKLVDMGNRPTTNNANIRETKKSISGRSYSIDKLNKQIAQIDTDLNKVIQHRESQITSINNRLSISTTPEQNNNKTEATPMPKNENNNGTIVRSFLYDTMTVICLLLASWYREPPNKTPADNVLVGSELIDDEDVANFDDATLLAPEMSDDDAAVFNTAQRNDDATLVQRSCNVATKHLQRVDTKSEPEKEDISPALISRAELKRQLKLQDIEGNHNDAISCSMIVKLCSEINSSTTASKFLKECAEEGILQGKLNGKSGVIYIYPTSVIGQISLLQGGLA
ncbi:hypothetical protein EOL70_13595 [Leucothrix sargassi]|nr:hypothetical protein EOL70_13595 [Leucothrix sargassi]